MSRSVRRFRARGAAGLHQYRRRSNVNMSELHPKPNSNPEARGATAIAPGSERIIVSSSTDAVLPVIQEQIMVGKRMVETATVEVKKTVTEGPEPVHVVVAHDETSVERVPVNRFVDKTPEIRYDGDTMIIPVMKEVAVVEKKLMLVEELHVTKRAVQTQETEYITVRREHLEVKRTPIDEGQAAVSHLSHGSGKAAPKPD
jgi:uncharacterized protein (TIGR02271 family)